MAELSDIHKEFLKLVKEGEEQKVRLQNSEIYPIVQKFTNAHIEKGLVQASIMMFKLDPGQMVKVHYQDLIDLYFLEIFHPTSIQEQEAKVDMIEMLCCYIPEEGYNYLEEIAFTRGVEQIHAFKILYLLVMGTKNERNHLTKEKIKSNFDSLDSDIQQHVKALFPDLFSNEKPPSPDIDEPSESDSSEVRNNPDLSSKNSRRSLNDMYAQKAREKSLNDGLRENKMKYIDSNKNSIDKNVRIPSSEMQKEKRKWWMFWS